MRSRRRDRSQVLHRAARVDIVGRPPPAALLLVAAFAAAACGTPLPPPAATATTAVTAVPGETEAQCNAWVASDVAGQELLKLDFTSASPQEIQSFVKAFWAEQERILLPLRQQVPPQLLSDIDVLLRLAARGQTTGDAGTLGSPELEGADRNIDEYMLRTCPYENLRVTAIDHSYQGVPVTVKAGTISITLTNAGRDTHEIIVSRIRDGVTEPFGEILRKSAEEMASLATPIAITNADAGETSTVFVPLEPGRYGFHDAYNEGTTSAFTPGIGPPHSALGMVTEIAVVTS